MCSYCCSPRLLLSRIGLARVCQSDLAGITVRTASATSVLAPSPSFGASRQVLVALTMWASLLLSVTVDRARRTTACIERGGCSLSGGSHRVGQRRGIHDLCVLWRVCDYDGYSWPGEEIDSREGPHVNCGWIEDSAIRANRTPMAMAPRLQLNARRVVRGPVACADSSPGLIGSGRSAS